MNWISIHIDLPLIDEKVLFYSRYKNIHIGHILKEDNRGLDIDGNEFFWFIDDSENTGFKFFEVTHWMNLPKGPNELD